MPGWVAERPPPSAAVPVAPLAAERVIPTYTVKRGDTLRTIAQEKGVNVRDLAAWNNIDNPNRLNVGQVLRLASPSAMAEALPIPGPTDVSGPGVTTAPLRTSPPVTEARGDAPPGASPPLAGPRTADNYKSSPKAIKEPYSPEAQRDFAKLAAGATAAAAPAAAQDVAGAPPVVARAEPSFPSTHAPLSVGDDDDRLNWT